MFRDPCEHCGKYSRAAINEISGEAARAAENFLLGYWAAQGLAYDPKIGHKFSILYATRITGAHKSGQRPFPQVEEVWAKFVGGERPTEEQLYS